MKQEIAGAIPATPIAPQAPPALRFVKLRRLLDHHLRGHHLADELD
jgi:hypothetical protein